MFDLFTILPLAVALFVFWRLYTVLGTRGGAEPPPADARRTAEERDNIVTLPNARPAEEREPVTIDTTRHANGDETLAAGLREIAAHDPDFDPEGFLDGARMAYEMIVTAFADGDTATLKNLLARDVYESFEQVIEERRREGLEVRTSFVGIEQARLVGAQVQGDEAQITVSFVSQIVSATVDSDENVIDGDLQEVAEVTDVWTFARSTRSTDPNWNLIATDDA